VIDVNSGNKATAKKNQETTALSVNMEAVREVARQLRLRDMGELLLWTSLICEARKTRDWFSKRWKDEMRERSRSIRYFPFQNLD